MPYRIIKPVIKPEIKLLCKKPYYNHKDGCPNFDKTKGCPPNTPLLGEVLDLSKPIWAMWVDFDLAEYRAKMLKLHPEWADKPRKLNCCLYWQGTALKELKHQVANFVTERILFRQNSRLDVLYRPEAYGVNVTETMKNIGIILEWPPAGIGHKIVRKIAFVGTPKTQGDDGD